jgi:hypothetical protein
MMKTHDTMDERNESEFAKGWPALLCLSDGALVWILLCGWAMGRRLVVCISPFLTYAYAYTTAWLG